MLLQQAIDGDGGGGDLRLGRLASVAAAAVGDEARCVRRRRLSIQLKIPTRQTN